MQNHTSTTDNDNHKLNKLWREIVVITLVRKVCCFLWLKLFFGFETLYLLVCGNPPVPSNGYVVGSAPYIQNKTIEYVCEVGYVLIGSENNKCLLDGSWKYTEGNLPVCTQGKLPIPQCGIDLRDIYLSPH